MYHITAQLLSGDTMTTHYWNGGIAMLPSRNHAKTFTADEAIAAFPQARTGWPFVEIVPAAANLFEQLTPQALESVAALVEGGQTASGIPQTHARHSRASRRLQNQRCSTRLPRNRAQVAGIIQRV